MVKQAPEKRDYSPRTAAGSAAPLEPEPTPTSGGGAIRVLDLAGFFGDSPTRETA